MSRLLSHFYVGLLSLAGSVALAQDPKPLHVDIAAQPVGDALNQFAEQSGLQVVLYADDAEGIEVVAVAGEFNNASLALDTLLASTGLEYAFINERTIAVAAAEHVRGEGGDSEAGNGWMAGATSRPVMMAQATVEKSQTSRRAETDSDEYEKKRPLEEIVVTGTLIRGIAPESSPTRTFDREDIQISGAATAQDFIQLMPQNFGGGSNPDLASGVPNDPNSQFNSGTTGSLGSSVNLRGLGSGSTLVLLNGHRMAPSSGIGNFVDISLIPASAIERVEVLTDGASSVYGADAIAGVVNFLLRDDYEGAEVSFRHGTVTTGDLNENRASATLGTAWESGNALLVYEHFKQDSLSVEFRSFSEGAVLPNDLLPAQKRHSVLASIKQELGPNITSYVDGLYSKRDADYNITLSNGQNIHSIPTAENLNLAAGTTWKISNSWFLDVSGTLSDVHNQPERVDLGTQQMIDSDLWTADVKASGDVIALPGGDVKIAIGGHFRSESFRNFDPTANQVDSAAERDVLAAYGEGFIPIVGPENSASGVRRLELNVSGRIEDFSDVGSSVNPKVGLLWSPFDSLNIRASYSTSFNPPPLGRTGDRGRIGTVLPNSFLSSLFGLPAPAPIEDSIVLALFGTGADLRPETSRAFTAGVDYLREWDRQHFDFNATYFDIDFEDRLSDTPVPDGLNGLVAQNVAFDNPDLFPAGTVIFNPSQNEIGEIVDTLHFIGGSQDPLDADIINFAGIVRNLAQTQVSGFDIDASYNIDTDGGSISVGMNASYLLHFQQQATSTSPRIEQLDTLYNPVRLRLRGHAGIAHNGISANLFVNYTDEYRVSDTVDAAQIDSWTTVDLSLSLDTEHWTNNPFFDNTIIRVSALNLFDTDPPSTPANFQFRIFGYDPTNASALGRFVSVELTKGF